MIDMELWDRADRVFPGGAVYLTRSARFAGKDTLPGFIRAASGCRVTDVNGKTYIDFTCGNGPSLLGYRHPEVEAAARDQSAEGDFLPFFNPAFVALGERLLQWGDGFGWSVVAKNGSDVTTLAARIARTATGRDKLILFERAYHGFGEEFVLQHNGDESDSSRTVRLPWNDVDALSKVAGADGAAVAAIMLNPLDQNPAAPAVTAAPEFIAAIRAFQQRTETLLILDDVRSGFRLDPKGSHRFLEIEPDLLCLGKAMGNGYAVSALLGKERLRSAAQRIMFTASHAFGAVACRAAVVTLDIYEREGAYRTIERAGTLLKEGLLESASRHGVSLSYTGPVTHPTVLFEDDPGQVRMIAFAKESAARGAIFHPRLNWFLCAAHDDAAIDEAVYIADQALQAIVG
jgi:glutamate-1-semialdehyde 2,1-aminomutase